MKKDTYYLKRILEDCELNKKNITFSYEEIVNEKTVEELGKYVRKKMLEKINEIEEYKTSISKLINEREQ